MARSTSARTASQAKEDLIGDWAEYRAAQGAEKASLILAHTRADVRELNLQARAILKERGELGKEVRVEVARELAADDGTISIERGERHFAPGDRVMFLKNDRELGVKNGTLGTVTEVKRDAMRVVLDGAAGRRSVSISATMRRSITAMPPPCTRRRAPRSIAPSCWPRPAWTAIWPTSA